MNILSTLCLIPLFSLAVVHAQIRSTRVEDAVPLQVETMYQKGLKYLQKSQAEDGSYVGSYGDDPAIMGFVLMSFLAHGDDPNVGPYSTSIKRCITGILGNQNKSTGYIGNSMYSHGFATLALAEAYGMVQDDRIGPALKRAVDLTVSAQKRNALGGWRYSPDAKDSDTSIVGCQMVSLYAARNAGIAIADEVFEKGLKVLVSCRSSTGSYGYTSPGSAVTLTAIGVLIHSLARKKDDEVQKASVAFLKKRLNHRDQQYPFYFEYYMSQALFQGADALWEEWNVKNIRYLSAAQFPDGSWPSEHSSAYSTAAALLSLALNFRFLPIYEK